jgi:hypothetical protein
MARGPRALQIGTDQNRALQRGCKSLLRGKKPTPRGRYEGQPRGMKEVCHSAKRTRIEFVKNIGQIFARQWNMNYGAEIGFGFVFRKRAFLDAMKWRCAVFSFGWYPLRVAA